MAKFYRRTGGAYGLWQRDLDGSLPGDVAELIEFDENANPTILDSLTGKTAFRWDDHTISAGQILRQGTPLVINPELPKTTQSRGMFAGGVRCSQDRSTTLGTYVDMPDLQFQLEANTTYGFSFDGGYTTAGTTTGIQLALNGPAFSFLAAGFEIGVSATTYLSAFAAAYDTGVNGTGSAGATVLPFHIFGNITTTASGILLVRGRSEIAGNQVTIKRGSYGMLFKVG